MLECFVHYGHQIPMVDVLKLECWLTLQREWENTGQGSRRLTSDFHGHAGGFARDSHSACPLCHRHLGTENLAAVGP